MKPIGFLMIALLTTGLLAGCSERQVKPTADKQQAKAEPAQMSNTTASHEPESHQASGGGAWSALAQMDSREPVPLLPMMANHQKQNMRAHLEAVQQIIAGVAQDDYGAVEEAAKRIGTSPQMTQMCQHMGAGAPGFTEQALAFHRTADGIVEAAQAKDQAKVMQALNATLATCTGCHAKYKQQVVTPEVWQQKTGMAPPNPGKMHHQMSQ